MQVHAPRSVLTRKSAPILTPLTQDSDAKSILLKKPKSVSISTTDAVTAAASVISKSSPVVKQAAATANDAQSHASLATNSLTLSQSQAQSIGHGHVRGEGKSRSITVHRTSSHSVNRSHDPNGLSTSNHSINHNHNHNPTDSKAGQASQPTKAKRDYFSSGRDFYDDGYTEEEQNINDLPTTFLPDDGTSDIGPSSFQASSCFLGRKEELRQLEHLRNQVIVDAQDDNHSHDNHSHDNHSHDDHTLTEQPAKRRSMIAAAPPKPALHPAALVWGVSGTGKSKLIDHFFRTSCDASPCYILCGKNDEKVGGGPFAAIVQAMQDFTSQLQRGPVDELDRLRACVRETFPSGGFDALVHLVPSLSILSPTHSDLETASTENAWNQLQYLFISFIKAVSTSQRPIYMFLDDLQWSSDVALKLLANLIGDASLRHFLLLGAIRQELNTDEVVELSPDDPLSVHLLNPLDSRALLQITVTNLSLPEMTSWLSALLGRDDIQPLCRKLYDKTHGNIFFTLQALEELERKNILVYSRISFEWEWNFGSNNNNNDDDFELPISDNIVSAIESKLRGLPLTLQHVLAIAANIRSTFDIRVLQQVVCNEQSHPDGLFATSESFADNSDALYKILERAVLEKLIANTIGGTSYRFIHDRIQQAAQGMIPSGELRNKLQLRLGQCLLSLYKTHKANDGLLFVAADHLNSIPTKNHLFTATLNLEVGEKALQMAALPSAAMYLQKATAALRRMRRSPTSSMMLVEYSMTGGGNDGDTDDYQIWLRLYRARCDVELSLTHLQLGYALGDEVLKNARTLQDKLPTYYTMARAMGRENRVVEAMHLEINLLRMLGKYPKKWYALHVMKDMSKMKTYMKINTDDQILDIRVATDPNTVFVMQVLRDISTRSYMTKNMLVTVLTILRMLHHSIRHGLTEDSAMAFAFFGVIVASSGDQPLAQRCASISHRILEKTKGKLASGAVCLLTMAYITPFSKPVLELLEQGWVGYTDSMEVGEIEMALLNKQSCILTAFVSGFELQPILHAIEIAEQEHIAYKVNSAYGLLREAHQVMRHMIGIEAIDWDQMRESANRDLRKEEIDPSKLNEIMMQFCMGAILCMYHREYAIAEGMMKNFLWTGRSMSSHLVLITRGFICGLIAAARYRETGQRRYLKTLKKKIKFCLDIDKTKGTNWSHHALLLQAEAKSIEKRDKASPKIKNAYDIAIVAAAKASCAHEAGLACELAGEHYVLHDLPDKVGDYFVHTIEYYREWGCPPLIENIMQRRQSFLKNLVSPGRSSVTQDLRQHLAAVDPSTTSALSKGRSKVLDVLSTYTPTGNSATKGRTSLASSQMRTQDLVEENDNVSVLTDGTH